MMILNYLSLTYSLTNKTCFDIFANQSINYHLSSCHHHSDELFIVDMSVSIDVCLSDHLVYLLVCEFLAQVGHHVSKLSCRNKTISVTIEHFESFNKLFFSVGVLHFSINETDDTLPSVIKIQGSR